MTKDEIGTLRLLRTEYFFQFEQTFSVQFGEARASENSWGAPVRLGQILVISVLRPTCLLELHKANGEVVPIKLRLRDDPAGFLN